MDSDTLLADISRRLESVIRIGTIDEIDHTAVRVVVKTGSLRTAPLPWLALRAGTTRTWSPPTVGEQVIVFCPSGEPAAGIVLCALNSDGIAPPDSSADTHVTVYADGARVSYNQATGHLNVSGIKTATLQASVKVILDVPETEVTGNVLIKGDLLVLGKATITQLLAYLSGMSGKPGASGGKTVIQGPVEQQGGDFKTDGEVIAGNIRLRDHRHPKNGAGDGITGGPQ